MRGYISTSLLKKSVDFVRFCGRIAHFIVVVHKIIGNPTRRVFFAASQLYVLTIFPCRCEIFEFELRTKSYMNWVVRRPMILFSFCRREGEVGEEERNLIVSRS